MKKGWIQVSRGGFITLLGLLLTIVIISIIWYMLFNVYFKKSVLDKETEEFFSEEGLDNSSHKAILDSTRKAVQDYNESVLRREKEIENMR